MRRSGCFDEVLYFPDNFRLRPIRIPSFHFKRRIRDIDFVSHKLSDSQCGRDNMRIVQVLRIESHAMTQLSLVAGQFSPRRIEDALNVAVRRFVTDHLMGSVTPSAYPCAD
jgi:hypothetical protein